MKNRFQAYIFQNQGELDAILTEIKKFQVLAKQALVGYLHERSRIILVEDEGRKNR